MRELIAMPALRSSLVAGSSSTAQKSANRKAGCLNATDSNSSNHNR